MPLFIVFSISRQYWPNISQFFASRTIINVTNANGRKRPIAKTAQTKTAQSTYKKRPQLMCKTARQNGPRVWYISADYTHRHVQTTLVKLWNEYTVWSARKIAWAITACTCSHVCASGVLTDCLSVDLWHVTVCCLVYNFKRFCQLLCYTMLYFLLM